MQAFGHASRKQQAIQRALIFSQHAVRSAGEEANAHQTELASAVASNRVDQIERFLLGTVPDNLRGHE
jgi:hypothetical protein